MTDLPSNQAYIQAEETDTESPISEQTLQKIGSAINYINDLFQQGVQYTSGGTFTVPEGITRLYVLGYGGGGGGCTFQGSVGGGGGSGCIPQLHGLSVTPLDEWTITIGAGGAGGVTGGNGGDTLFFKTSNGRGIRFCGAQGARQETSNPSEFSLVNFFVNPAISPLTNWTGGHGMRGISDLKLNSTLTSQNFPTNIFPNMSYYGHYTIGGRGDTTDGGNNTPGQSSPYAAGGSVVFGGDRAGSGGAGFGAGGDATVAATGGSAGANSGAGGGGGISTGGSGGSGGLFVLY